MRPTGRDGHDDGSAASQSVGVVAAGVVGAAAMDG